MEAIIIYDNNKDRELFELINSKFPIFVSYINFNTTNGRKEAYKIKSYWGAVKNPFVVVSENDQIINVFYSEKGENAINQLINFLNDSKNKETE